MQLSNNPYFERKIPNQLKDNWRFFAADKSNILALSIVILLIFICIFASILEPYSPFKQVSALSIPPFWRSAGSLSHIFGTDNIGRDILSRLIHGTRQTFGDALIVTFFASLIGSTIGIIAAFKTGLKSSIISHLFDSIKSIPFTLIGIVFVVFFGHGQQQILFAIFFSLIPIFIRGTFMPTKKELEANYICAARLDGAENFYLFYHSVLPNILPNFTILTSKSLSQAILGISTLGFLGLGATAPACEWGHLLSDALPLIHSAPWRSVVPCVFITLSIASINTLGEGIKDMLTKGIE